MSILGLDYGTKRIGSAVSDPRETMAMPLEVIPVQPDDAHFARIEQLVGEYQVNKLVVGLPYNMDGSIGPSGERAMAFADKLRERLKLPVEMWDERLSSEEAHDLLFSANMNARKRRNVVDKIAASLILKAYLDAHPA